MINVSICICTRKRQAGLKRLLESIDQLQIPSITNVRIIVVENDTDKFSENIVNEFSSKGKITLDYYLEPRQGIVFARNRSVKEAANCDFCCFTDDDQIITANWLEELIKCQKEFDADGVAGPTFPVFEKEVPPYIKNFHQPKTYPYGTVVNTAYTGCLLLRKKYLDKLNGPFDERLNFTGGEDSHLTYLVTKAGGIIRYNPDAVANEIVVNDRASARYALKRAYSISITTLFVESLIDEEFSRINYIPRLILRFINGVIIGIPFLIFGKAKKLKGLDKIARAVGGMRFFLGKHEEFYK
jgi:succinoglycan biosynthesis protein ExoM